MSMPNYIQKALKRLQYSPTIRPQYSPHRHMAPQYDRKGEQQLTPPPDRTTPLSNKETTHIQLILGTLLYYARALDCTILPALNELSSQQSAPTMVTRTKAQQVLDYVATYPHTFVRYKASDMVLHCDSDAAYLVAPKARSRIAGYYHLSDHHIPPPLNGPIHVECRTLRHVVASAAEAETAGVFHNAQTIISIRRILLALNHPQPPTPLKSDNSTTIGFIHDNIHQRRSKSWDMRYYWLRNKNPVSVKILLGKGQY